MAITFARLRDGTWGLRATDYSRRRIVPGARVEVSKADGTTRWVNVDRVIHRGRFGVLATIARDEPAEPPMTNMTYTTPVRGRYETPTVTTEEVRRFNATHDGYGAPVVTAADVARETGADRDLYGGADDFADGILERPTPPAATGPALSGATVGTVIRTDRLNWHGPTRTFTVEISDLRDDLPNRFAPPASLGLESHETGRVVDFALNRVDRDRDGDVAGWEYLSAGDLGLKLLIIND